MKRILKATALLFVLFAAFSLAGCGSTMDTAKETKKEAVKTAETAKQAEQKQQVEESAKVDAAEEKQTAPEKVAESASIPSEEKETEQPAAKPETPKQNAPASQAKPETSKANTAASPSKSSPAPAAQPSKPAAPSTPPPTDPPKETPKPELAVTISIAGPESGPKDKRTILGATKVNFKDGATIFDIISQTAKKQGIVVDSRGSGATAYIEGIDNIYEFDYGVKSGWIFKQNGVSLTKSIGIVKVKDGDRIECFYTE
ncbi:DUF4430 domain-containing protein [Neobacillus novalis]|uniref:DUF4430 domain-containing protein n=1 Tax=Neobacillus novalis TaxID=220687 RepID=A0AA95MVB6_9BACI|nr:DUF4430 domain-containing protein [Neobacillus novalis]WHY88358.1 DUF4430 domain-containing protein [Neobacillus novalis]